MTNPNDPLLKSGPQKQRQLFERYANASEGFPAQEVVGAAVNLLINAIRQSCATRKHAEQVWDDYFGKGKNLLLDHYDSVTGKRRNIFPFTQHINTAHVLDKDKLRG